MKALLRSSTRSSAAGLCNTALGFLQNAEEAEESLLQRAKSNLRSRDSLATGQHCLQELSQFVLSLNSSNSRYDKYLRHEPGGELTAQEINGLSLFRQHCASCHTEPLFTNGGFANNGLPVDTALRDFGRMRTTGSSQDSLLFKIPTLRNIQFTYPYMHDGRFKKLLEVVNHYTGKVQESKTLDKRLKAPIVLSAHEKIDLVAFLLTLTDRKFLFDPRFGFPRD